VNKSAAGGTDRTDFQEGINQFKQFFSASSVDQMNNVQPEIKQKIDLILEIENSVYFKVFDLVSDKADVFCRYFYLAAVCFYLAYFSSIVDLHEVAIASSVVGFFILSVYLHLLLRKRMRKSSMTCCQAFCHYLHCRCIHK